MPDIFETIMHRRSIRRFEPKQIEEAVLQQILQAGLYAPSAGGRQGVIFAVCQDKEVNERLGKIKRAPKNFLFSVDDCAVAAENMMLAADALGIGSCYIGQGWPAFADPYGQEILRQWNIPVDHYAVMQLLLGYPRESDRHPTPKPRKEGRVIRIGGNDE